MNRFDSDSTSPSKGGKRFGSELGWRFESGQKRIKMRDLESVLRSEETEFRHLDTPTIEEVNSHLDTPTIEEVNTAGPFCKKEENSQDTGTVVKTREITLSLLGVAASASICHVGGDTGTTNPQIKTHAINESSCNITTVSTTNGAKPSLPKENDKKGFDLNISHPSALGLDLNAEDVSNILDQNPFYPYKSLGHVKSNQPSECGSCTGPLEDNEALKVWKTMKQNGFLSSSHGGIPIPKQRGPSKKSKNDAFKKNIQLAKREQVNKLTKIAAPSGLLSGLNPGIINHVRNSKQVRSIIEAIVKSEKPDAQIRKGQLNHSRNDGKEIDEGKDPEYMCGTGCRQTEDVDLISLNNPSISSSSDSRDGVYKSELAGATFQSVPSVRAHVTSGCEDEKVKLKLSSGLENASCLSQQEFSPNQNTITSLSIKAASVASQWLELLHLDIRGRLAALKRSRKRIRTMIRRELPSLVSQDFRANQENDPCFEQSSGDQDMHIARWRLLFSQMEKTLSEEGKHLESWLRQVQEMQKHCEQGLEFVNLPFTNNIQQSVSLDKISRLNKSEALEREFAVRAAAASIYSTCNLLMTAENASFLS